MKTWEMTPFVPAPLISSAHAQTIYASLFRPRHTPEVRRERWELPDGDFLDVDWLDAAKGRPYVLILHGLEGSSRQGYVAAAVRAAATRGVGALALNFRSCGGEPNRTLRSYNSADTTDVRFALDRLRETTTGPLVGLGFSLGANVLLRYLAEEAERCLLSAAAAVSTPFDLQACARAIDSPADPVMALYRRHYLKPLREKALAKSNAFPEAPRPEVIRTARTVEGFDHLFTAPLWGFRGASDYYAHASSGPVLTRVRRPTLLLSSADDPIAPASSFPHAAIEKNREYLRSGWVPSGGHVGFVAGSWRRPVFWAEEQAIAFLVAHA